MAKPEMDPEAGKAPELTRQEAWNKRLREHSPDLDWDNDPNAMYSALDNYDKSQNEKLSKYEASQAKLNDVMLKDPRFGRALHEAVNGGNGSLALIRHYGKDALASADDPEFAEQFIQAQQEFADNVARDGQMEEEQRANLEASMETLEQLASENNMSEEEFTSFMDSIIQDAQDVIMGKITKEYAMGKYLAMHHPEDIEAAYKLGMADASNKKIRTESKQNLGDGIPAIASAGAGDKPKSVPAYQKRDVFKDWENRRK